FANGGGKCWERRRFSSPMRSGATHGGRCHAARGVTEGAFSNGPTPPPSRSAGALLATSLHSLREWGRKVLGASALFPPPCGAKRSMEGGGSARSSRADGGGLRQRTNAPSVSQRWRAARHLPPFADANGGGKCRSKRGGKPGDDIYISAGIE